MKRICIGLMIFILFINTSVAFGDFKVIQMNDLTACFERNASPSSWVNSTDRSRAFLWLYACNDLNKSDPTFDFFLDDEIPMAIMGTGDAIGTKGFNNTIYMYVRDSDDLYRQIVICPERNYMIIEDSGIPYRKAKEDVNYKAVSCFELTYTDIQSGIDEFKTELPAAQNPTSSDKTQEIANPEETNTSSNELPPSLIGPFTGDVVDVKIGNITYHVHRAFKEALDKYEEYFDTYIKIVKNGEASVDLTEYSEVMNKYIEFMEALEKLEKIPDEEKKWSEEEAAYYLQVTIRIYQKLNSSI